MNRTTLTCRRKQHLLAAASAFCLLGCSGGRQMVLGKRDRPPALLSHSESQRDFPAESAKPIRDRPIPSFRSYPPETSKQETERPAQGPEPIADSNLTLDEALDGSDAPENVNKEQVLVKVEYYSFDQKLHQGQILVNKDLADDVRAIFEEIKQTKFPIDRVVPISRYGWSDDRSVAADNSSGFNYRDVPATHHLSNHALGRAIDINPLENPYRDPIHDNSQKYDPSVPGTLTSNSPPTVIFKKHGWTWGGVWRRGRDYQHFEKL